MTELKSNASLRSVYTTKENGIVNTGALLVKTDANELITITEKFKNTTYDATNGWGGSGIFGLGTEGFLTYYYSLNSQNNYGISDSTMNEHVMSFSEYPQCRKPWECYVNSNWTSDEEQECRSLNMAWYKYRKHFEENWSKPDLVNTTQSEYHTDHFLGYCVENGTEGYLRASDYSSTTSAPTYSPTVSEVSVHDLHPGDGSFWCQECTGPLLADTLLTYQRNLGGWPKNINPVPGENYTGSETYGSLDNGATVYEIRFMAQAWKETGVELYRDSAQAGFDMVFNAQYPSGGWPQYWPLKPEGAYANAVTFNDNLHKNVMELLDELVARQSPFDVTPFLEETRSEESITRGIQVLLDAQVLVDPGPGGVCPTRTNWCAQHDPISLDPVAARSHEPVSYSGNEGMRLAQYLMTIENPSEEIKDAIVGAYVWAKKATMTGYYKALDEDGNKILVPKEDAQLWPRFANIPDLTPIFCDRGCVQNSSLMYHDWPDVSKIAQH